MILEIFKDSFEYSSKDWKTIAKLAIISIFNSLILPVFLIQGYSYRIIVIGINGLINGDDPLPEFNNWINMFIEGIKVFIVRFIYLLPGTIVFIAILFSQIFFLNSLAPNFYIGSEVSPPIEMIGVIWMIIVIPIILWLFSYLISNIAIANMANNKGSLKSALNFKEIIKIIKSIGVFKYIEFYIGYIVIFVGLLTTAAIFILLFSSVLGIFSIVISSSFDIGAIILGILSYILLSLAFLVLGSFFIIFESRAIALMYNTREEA